jgi:hypothetical protein
MHFSLLIYFNNYPLPVSNRLTIHHQEAVTVYAAYGIYHAENTMKLCKITHTYTVTESINHCFNSCFNMHFDKFRAFLPTNALFIKI